MEAITRRYELSAEACDEAAELVAEFCAAMRVDKRDAVRYRLAAEDCLVHWLENGLRGHEMTLRTGRRLRTPFMTLEVEGPKDDPGAEGNDEFGPYCASILSALGLEPEYSYARRRNRVRFRMKRKPLNQLVMLALVGALTS